MKTLLTYINENAAKLREIQSNISKYVKNTYGEYNGDNYIKLIEDEYKQYLEETTKLSDADITSQYDNMCKTAKRIISKYGIGQFENGCIGYGWFEYINNKIQNENTYKIFI